ncbi:MAG: hypothetical protein JWP91_2693 [Fibrobacteres bacterium]|nr:hypothetical protein [Fibrobacterota bacterium]
MRMNFILMAALVPMMATAEDAKTGATDSEKIDSLLVMQKQVVRTIKNDPLADKSFGVEANLARLLLATEFTSFSGGVSLFALDRNAEIALPFYYGKSESHLESGDAQLSNVDFTEITQDIHYRYFLGNTQNGFYLSAFSRLAWLDGVKGDNEFDGFLDTANTNPPDRRSTEAKLGLGVGLGYRIFSYKGLYWGCGMSFGRYVLGENDKFRGAFFSLDNDEKFIFDVELLKFGWAF